MSRPPTTNNPTPPSRFALPPGGTPPPPLQTASQPSGRGLAVWTVAYLLTWWFVFAGAIGHNLTVYQLALLSLLGEGVWFFARGPAGRSLAAWWRARSSEQKVGYGCLAFLLCGLVLGVMALVLPFWPAGVLVKGTRQYYRERQQRPSQHLKAGWERVRTGTRGFQVGVAAGALLVVCALMSTTGVVIANPNVGFVANTSTPGVSQSGQGGTGLTQGNTSTSPAATDTPEPTATATPKPKPTATPVPATPTPKLICTDAGCSPWGYNFSHGHFIYRPPSTFCSYFNCISSFWEHTNGYVVECQDQSFSHSGGVQGSCSHHGGDWRPLLAP